MCNIIGKYIVLLLYYYKFFIDSPDADPIIDNSEVLRSYAVYRSSLNDLELIYSNNITALESDIEIDM